MNEEGTASSTGGPAHPLSPAGLSRAEVADRVADGRVNGGPARSGRRVRDVVRANVVTRFNVLMGVLFVATFAVGARKDTLFIWVVVANVTIGIAQEVRALRALERLSFVSMASVLVRRDGTDVSVSPAEVVDDDLLVVGRGDQLPVDGVVVEQAGLEVDESLLTGEADPVMKSLGAMVLSGSVLVAGSGVVRATAVGSAAYARRLTDEARQFSLTGSELRAGTDRILRVVTWFLVPTSALLLWSQLVANETIKGAVQGTVAGVSGMVPEGLVLMTSLAFAAGVVRLGRRNVLTRELAAIEGLARIDMLLVDKTGTLTVAGMKVTGVEAAPASGDIDEVDDALAALAASDHDPNPTMAAIAIAYPTSPGWIATEVIPFSSARRWSGASFTGHGTWRLGALEAFRPDTSPADRLDETISTYQNDGYRTLVLAHQDHDVLPGGAWYGRIVAIVTLSERVKSDVAATVAYFGTQGVELKVVSGDNPTTVAAVARRAGVAVIGVTDASRADEDDDSTIVNAAATSNVFGRVGPHQKAGLVSGLQADGHTVAMIGDGVNDLLALKRADVGIAMGQGSPAARAVAQFVLLDGQFEALPAVVAEGRRVIANIERVARLFLTKTTYAFTLALATGVARLPFPFLPRQLSLVAALTIGIPGFLLALETNDTRSQPGFVRRVLTSAVPAGFVAALASFVAYADARSDQASLTQARSTAAVVLFAVAMVVLADAARPLRARHVVMLAVLTTAFVSAVVFPANRHYFEFAAPPAATWLKGVATAAGAVLLLLVSRRLTRTLTRSV